MNNKVIFYIWYKFGYGFRWISRSLLHIPYPWFEIGKNSNTYSNLVKT